MKRERVLLSRMPLVLGVMAVTGTSATAACTSDVVAGDPVRAAADAGSAPRDAGGAVTPEKPDVADRAPQGPGSDASPPIACGGQGDPTFIDWAKLKNPILSRPDRMLKDQSVAYVGGAFYVFASQRISGATAHPVMWKTHDFRTYEEMPDPGAHSPDVANIDGTWHMVFQRAVDASSDVQALFHTSSADLETWTAAKLLMPSMDPSISRIDGAIAREGGHYYVGFKDRGDQKFYVTESSGSGLDGAWSTPVPADAGGEWAENFQFIKIDGVWRMIATGHNPSGPTCLNFTYACNHEPFIYRMAGSGAALADWTTWIDRTHLEVPKESWNSTMHANTGFLVDWRAHDGYFYLFYSGSSDLISFDLRTHGKLGVVRSCDLVHWKLPGEF